MSYNYNYYRNFAAAQYLYYINHKCTVFQATLYMMNYQLYLRSITYIMCYYYLFKESSGF